MKALLTWHEVPFRKTHDLAELQEACLRLAPSAADQLLAARQLSPYAWRFRYRGAPYQPDIEEAEEAQQIAAALFEALSALMSSSRK